MVGEVITCSFCINHLPNQWMLLATEFFEEFQLDHKMHSRELGTMRVIKYSHHVQENEFAKNFRSKKYPIQMSSISYDIFFDFLQDNPPNGSSNSFLFRLVNQSLNIEGTCYTVNFKEYY